MTSGVVALAAGCPCASGWTGKSHASSLLPGHSCLCSSLHHHHLHLPIFTMLPLLLLATVAAAAAAAASPSPASSSRATITRPPPTPTPTTTTRTLTPSYQRRQEVSNLFGVQSTSSLHVAATVVSVAPTGTPSADATTTEAGELKQWSTVPVAASMGLIMPEPGSKILVSEYQPQRACFANRHPDHTYDFGWIEDGQRPAPYALGWLRIIQPMLILPNYTVSLTFAAQS